MLKQACPELVSGFSMTIHFTGIVKPVRNTKTQMVRLVGNDNLSDKKKEGYTLSFHHLY
jgi:hypothetical protein